MALFNSNVYVGQEARDHLLIGADVVANAVKVTLGAKGTNAILQESAYPYHIVTNDGISIAQKVLLQHPVQQMGANIMKEVADRSNKESGDGTTTAITLAQAILHAGKDCTGSPIEIKRSLDACLPAIFESIDAQKKTITVDDVGAVASISAEDEKLGAMFQKIYQEIGKDGIIELDNSGTFETSYVRVEGVKLRFAAYLSPYMANEGTKAVYKNPKILIAKQRISTLADIDPLFQQLSGAGINELVMYVEDIDAAVLSALAFTHMKGIFKTLIIKAPTLWKDWLYEDFAKITGATIVESASGVTFQNVGVSHLGTCEKLITTKEDTTVIGICDISEHLKTLEEENTDDSKLRLSWLNTKAAVFKLGANSESELSYVRLKAEDARNAAHLALQDGVVPGGGVTLLTAVEKMPDTVGGRILKIALRAPLKQICINAGYKAEDHLDSVMVEHMPGVSEVLIGTKGVDAKRGLIVDMWDAQIIDAATVTKNSVKNAISIAGTLLTTSVAIPTNIYESGDMQR